MMYESRNTQYREMYANANLVERQEQKQWYIVQDIARMVCVEKGTLSFPLGSNFIIGNNFLATN